MPLAILAQSAPHAGWVRVSWPYHPKLNSTLREILKELPGTRWGGELVDENETTGQQTKTHFTPPGPWPRAAQKVWWVPWHSWHLIKAGFKTVRDVKLVERQFPPRVAPLHPTIAERLRDYQRYAVDFCTTLRGALLAMEMRTGKTFVALGVVDSLMRAGYADAMLTLYPSSATRTWREQTGDLLGIDLFQMQGESPLLQMEINERRAADYLYLGCSYEILPSQETSLARLLEGRNVVLIYDEAQYLKNYKAGRSKVARRLTRGQPFQQLGDTEDESIPAAMNVVGTYSLTGTPIENWANEYYSIFDYVIPDSIGGFRRFAERYCSASLNERGHYETKGLSEENLEELKSRAGIIMLRKTRAEVAPWLPKTDRRIVMCDDDSNALQQYRSLEQEYAVRLKRVLREDEASSTDREMLQQMAKALAPVKVKKAVERGIEYLRDHQAKVVVFAYHRETMVELTAEWEHAQSMAIMNGQPYIQFFDATTEAEASRAKRDDTIQEWREHKGPAALLLSAAASREAIDLSQALGSIIVELLWVPTKARQLEDRIVDVHQGTRDAPPIVEYIVMRGTVDEAVASAVIGKIRTIEQLGLGDEGTKNLAKELRTSGLVGADRLGLENTDRDTVLAAIAGLRAKLLGGERGSATAALAGTIQAEWEDDEVPAEDEL